MTYNNFYLFLLTLLAAACSSETARITFDIPLFETTCTTTTTSDCANSSNNGDKVYFYLLDNSTNCSDYLSSAVLDADVIAVLTGNLDCNGTRCIYTAASASTDWVDINSESITTTNQGSYLTLAIFDFDNDFTSLSNKADTGDVVCCESNFLTANTTEINLQDSSCVQVP